MNLEIEKEIGNISSSVSRIEGLYQKWAQNNDVLYGVVQVLYILRFNDGVTQKQISEICEIPKQTINNVIRQFKADKYITLVSSPEDKREKQIILTQAGQDYSQKILKPFFAVHEKVGNRLGIQALQQLVESITNFCDVLEMEMELYEVTLKWDSKEKTRGNKEDV